MDDHTWLILVEWGLRIAGWIGLAVNARRAAAAPYAAAAQALRELPAGGEAGGVGADGSSWYLRVPARTTGGAPGGR